MMGKLWVALTMFILLFYAIAAADTLDAEAVRDWLEDFAGQMGEYAILNEPQETLDAARPGEVLFQYDFGTVSAGKAAVGTASDIIGVELFTPQVSDPRGKTVGMTMKDAIGNGIAHETTALWIVETQEAGYGWCWAYIQNGSVQGVEYVTYDTESEPCEYRLTYVMEGDAISSIRLTQTPVSMEQMEENVASMEAMHARQEENMLIAGNAAKAFEQSDMSVFGQARLGGAVSEWIAVLGEPETTQELPGSAGRILIFGNTTINLAFDERTGTEAVCSVSTMNESIAGPRGLRAGMPMEEAAALFRCDAAVYQPGGMLYMDSESVCAALIQDEDGARILRYLCPTEEGHIGILELIIREDVVSAWRMDRETMNEEG